MKQLPPKLSDCSQHSDSELFIVEGDSAARAVSANCDKSNQAVLPMQGKPMNAMKADRDDILEHPKYADVLASLGIYPAAKASDDHKQAGFQFDLEEIRYQRIVLLFDPDADGIHARTLMHLFFYRWLRPLLDAGRVLDTHPPLWQVTADQLSEPLYAFTQQHFDRIRKQLADPPMKLVTTRYRGLGSIPGETLSRLCLAVPSRSTSTVTAETAETALAIFAEMRQFGSQL